MGTFNDCAGLPRSHRPRMAKVNAVKDLSEGTQALLIIETYYLPLKCFPVVGNRFNKIFIIFCV